jgi:hypothetical protein
MKEQLEKMRADNPKITEQFADLKRDLAQVGLKHLMLQLLAEVVMQWYGRCCRWQQRVILLVSPRCDSVL